MAEHVIVMMAAYNGENYILQQLNSIYDQENVYAEIIVRDDGSTDRTPEILAEQHNLARLSYYTGEHLGVNRSFLSLMKYAYENTDGLYFAFCDQDDVWDKDKLKIAVDSLSPHSDTPSAYYSGQRLVDQNLSFICNHTLNTDRNNHARFLLNDAAGCTMVFNRLLLEKILAYAPKYMLCHDAWCVKVCLALGGYLCVDPTPHISYRQHGKNVLGLKSDPVSLVRRVYHYIIEQMVEEQMKELLQGYDSEIVDEYREIIDCVLDYRNPRSKSRLKDNEWIHFGNKDIRIVFLIKLLLNKL